MKDAGKVPVRILAIGESGAGKTTQFWTLPAPRLALMFDPGGLASLRGLDADVETFFPDNLDLHLKGVSGGERPPENGAALAWERFNKFMLGSIREGLFQKYSSILLDSITTMQLLCSQGVTQSKATDFLVSNPRATKGATGLISKDDYTPIKQTIGPAVAQVCFLPVANVLVTAHVKENRTEEGVFTGYSLNAVGELRTSLSTFFDNVWHLYRKGTTEAVEYYAHTHATSEYKGLKTSFRSLNAVEQVDMTIKDWSHAEQFGIGKILSGG